MTKKKLFPIFYLAQKHVEFPICTHFRLILSQVPANRCFSIWPVNMWSSQVWMRKSAFLELQLARKELRAVGWADGLEVGAKNRFPKFSVIMSNKYILSIWLKNNFLHVVSNSSFFLFVPKKCWIPNLHPFPPNFEPIPYKPLFFVFRLGTCRVPKFGQENRRFRNCS